jgi:hypothetical protein
MLFAAAAAAADAAAAEMLLLCSPLHCQTARLLHIVCDPINNK